MSQTQEPVTGFQHFEGCGGNWVREPVGGIFDQEEIHPSDCPRCKAILAVKRGDIKSSELAIQENRIATVEQIKRNVNGDFNPFQ